MPQLNLLTISRPKVSPDADRVSDWRDEAECRAYDSELWFPTSSASEAYDAPREICGVCPVRQACLDDALNTERGYRYGMRGGKTPKQRQRTRKTREAERPSKEG